MERWLTQRMSTSFGVSVGRSDGVCANVEFPLPRRLVGDAVAAASGIDPAADGWLAERMVWPLLEVVDACLDEPWLSTLAGHLGDGDRDGDTSRQARRFSTVRHLAGLFDRYALHRPEMVRAWAEGRDTDGMGGDLPTGAAWQAELWRRLNERLPEPGPAERLDRACERLREEPGLVDVPDHLSLFGLTRLPSGHLHVLRALSENRDVHLFLLHPSPALWAGVAEKARSGGSATPISSVPPCANTLGRRLIENDPASLGARTRQQSGRASAKILGDNHRGNRRP